MPDTEPVIDFDVILASVREAQARAKNHPDFLTDPAGITAGCLVEVRRELGLDFDSDN